MEIQIRNQPVTFDLYGFSGIAADRNYGKAGSQLGGKMWDIVRSRNLKHKGINHWVYESGNKMFVGVELEETPQDEVALEHRTFTLSKYLYARHIGPYHLLKNTYDAMRDTVQKQGMQTMSLSVEIYGHWNSDESKLETEILISVK